MRAGSARSSASGGRDRSLKTVVRDLERRLHADQPRLAITSGALPSWVVDPEWSELSHCNDATRHLLGLAAPVIAPDLLAAVMPDDVSIVGHLAAVGGHAVVRFRTEAGVRHLACIAVPRRSADGEVRDSAFLAADITNDADQAEDRAVAVRLAVQPVDGTADSRWAGPCRELRLSASCRSVTIVAVADPDTVIALDPPTSTPSPARHAVTRALVRAGRLSRTCFAVPAGDHHAVLLEGPGIAATVVADGTRARAVLDELAWRIETEQSLSARLAAAERELARLRTAAAERDDAIALAASAERGRVSAAQTAEAAFAQLADLSHELRNALNTICGFAQLLERQSLDEPHARAVHHISVAGDHLSTLLDGVLDLAQLDGGREELTTTPTAVRPLVEDAVALARVALEARSVSVDVRCGPDPVLADAPSVRQVLVNLLTNAAKYGRAGGRVAVTARRHGPLVRVEVADDGPGIAPEKVATLFGRYERGGLNRWDEHGLGLGLALCQRLVERMRGSIGVDSVVGAGATFWFELPAASPAPGQSMNIDRVVAVTASDEATMELVHGALAATSVNVWPLRSAWATIELLRDTEVDALVVDVDVDDADELVAFARRLSPRPRVLTLHNGARADGSLTGDVELQKPFDLGDLRRGLELEAVP